MPRLWTGPVQEDRVLAGGETLGWCLRMEPIVTAVLFVGGVDDHRVNGEWSALRIIAFSDYRNEAPFCLVILSGHISPEKLRQLLGDRSFRYRYMSWEDYRGGLKMSHFGPPMK